MNTQIPTLSTIDEGTISGVGQMSGFISEYGVAVVIMAIFFIIFIGLLALILRSNHKMMTQIMNNNTSDKKIEDDILNKFVESALKVLTETVYRQNPKLNPQATKEQEDKDEDYHKDLVGAYIDVNMTFKDASRCALTRLNCDRVAIYVFHNGNTSSMGLPFFKMSCVHEWTNRGGSTLRGKSHSDMPLHLFNDFIENLYSDGYYRIDDVTNPYIEDPSIKEFTSFSDTKSLYIVAIKNSDGIITGFSVAEFHNKEIFETDIRRDKDVKEVLEQMIYKIAPIINNKYTYNKRSK